MSQTFAIYNGQVMDWHFYKDARSDDVVSYSFYIDDWHQGRIFKMRKYWSAVSHGKDLKGLRSVEGFRTRYDAAAYILRTNGVWE